MMMLYAVRDVKADAFCSIMCNPTLGIALRAFQEACADPRTELAKYPEDYMLYELGTYDQSSGAIVPYQLPKLVATASEVCSRLKAARLVAEPELPGVEVVK